MKLTQKQKQIFDGLIISDACLSKSSKNGNARFSLVTKSKQFAEEVYRIFPSFPWSNPAVSTRNRHDKRTGKSYSSTAARTRVDSFFTEQYQRWYPHGKKIIPKDIQISKDMLLWWYIGDGHLRRKKSRPNYRRVELATDSFKEKDILNVIEKVKLFLKEEDNIYIESNEIMIAKKSLHKFACLFKNGCNVSDYSYKFEFGQYLNVDYFKNSFKNRPISYINEFRKINKVRELNFISKNDIKKVKVK